MHAVNTESVFLKPQAIRHLFPEQPSTTDQQPTEESKEVPPRKESEEQQLWGGLLTGDAKIPFRIESFEAQQKKALAKEQQRKDDDDGKFNCLTSISVIEVKQKKKKRR